MDHQIHAERAGVVTPEIDSDPFFSLPAAAVFARLTPVQIVALISGAGDLLVHKWNLLRDLPSVDEAIEWWHPQKEVQHG